MKLLQFRVKSFRSIGDTGWIDLDDVTAFIGTNESGKSNLLLALWKLNPAREGEIDLKSDAPRKSYNNIRNMDAKPVFIEADFELDEEVIGMLVNATASTAEELTVARVGRDFDGNYFVSFPEARSIATIPKAGILVQVDAYNEKIAGLQPAGKTEKPLYESMLATLSEAVTFVQNAPDKLAVRHLKQLQTLLHTIDLDAGLKSSEIVPAFQELLEIIDEQVTGLSRPSPDDSEKAQQVVLGAIPKFIYYANYGNLDSEIYLPHVITNMERSDLGSHEAAKARTLKVLFEFVKLKPKEILELGKDFDDRQRQPTDDEIHEIAEKKREREILLQSASTDLTQKFLSWWRQGNYRFRFQADGNHFRIWVADEIRPEEIELEGRSAGLQWFLSFFLVFLVERSESHQNAILLLDEPGVSLHPIAQEDLFEFFETLSQENQIIYTAHSPFMVDSNHLDRVKAVYFDETGDEKGLTKVSADLRAKEKQTSEERSVYPVHAALGLTVSPVLLVGCQPVIVEGMSDQYYFSAIKNLLISRGHIKPPKELLFLPSGSFKGIKAVVPILVGREESLPFVILDADKPGQQIATQLLSSLYSSTTDRVINLGDICGFEEAEVEDLMPVDVMSYVLTRYLRGPEEEFSEIVDATRPIVPQVEAYANKHNIKLDKGWKVEVAKLVKERVIRRPETIRDEDDRVEKWKLLFTLLQNETT